MLKKRRRAAPLICNFDLNSFATVMAFVVFVILIIEMLVPGPGCGGTSIEMARMNNSKPMEDAAREDAIIIAITRDGHVYLDSDYVEPHTLPRLICNRLADASVRKVFLKVDRMAKYAVVNSVLADVRATGTGNITFLVEQRYRKPASNLPAHRPGQFESVNQHGARRVPAPVRELTTFRHDPQNGICKSCAGRESGEWSKGNGWQSEK